MQPKHYIGTKRVIATPMNRADYNAYRGWTLPADENGADDGFLVEYVDGGKANDSRHAGYISWSPADVFYRAYQPAPEPVAGLKPHEQRVVEEKHALDAKCEKLFAFLDTPLYDSLPEEDQSLLQHQFNHMTNYSEVLAARIARFKD
jgi:hypothetical protein